MKGGSYPQIVLARAQGYPDLIFPDF